MIILADEFLKQASFLSQVRHTPIKNNCSPSHRTLRELITSPLSRARRHANSPNTSDNNTNDDKACSPFLRPKKRVLNDSDNVSPSQVEKVKKGSLMQCLSPRRKRKMQGESEGREAGGASPVYRQEDILSPGTIQSSLTGCLGKSRHQRVRPVISEVR